MQSALLYYFTLKLSNARQCYLFKGRGLPQCYLSKGERAAMWHTTRLYFRAKCYSFCFLLMIYLNASILNKTSVADDSNLTASGDSITDLEAAAVNSDLENLRKCLIANKL